MQTLIDDLLSFSRVSAQENLDESIDLGAAYGQAIANLQSAIEESGATVTCDRLPTMKVNQSQLARLFQNLIGNGIKFRGDEPPTVHIGAEQRDGKWRFSVRDNGIGIAPKYLDRIFEMFKTITRQGQISRNGCRTGDLQKNHRSAWWPHLGRIRTRQRQRCSISRFPPRKN